MRSGPRSSIARAATGPRLATALAIVIAAAFSVGCGSSQAASSTTVRSAGGSCAERSCDADHAGNTCEQGEQHCTCGVRPVCSGADLGGEPGYAPSYGWSCEYREGATRPDGCPGRAPADGSACEGELSCQYGSCCIDTVVCEDGRWHSTGRPGCPP